MTRNPPKYRLKNGKNIAIVTLTDSVTKQRRDFCLGQHDTRESRENYYKLIAEWESSGRRLPKVKRIDTDPDSTTITQMCLAYFEWANGYYSAGESNTLRIALRLFRKHHGSEPVDSVGPVALRSLREVMINELDWSRNYTNSQVARIKRMYKWAASREMIEISTYQSVSTLESLKRGRSQARETAKVQPVDPGVVSQTIPYLNRQVAAMVEIQLATGARPGEVVIMRPCDIDRSGDVWIYIPHQYKTKHLDKPRTIYLGPQAQKIIIPFLNRDQHEYMFSPLEATEERRANEQKNRKTPSSCGNTRGSNRVENPAVSPGDHYTTQSDPTSMRSHLANPKGSEQRRTIEVGQRAQLEPEHAQTHGFNDRPRQAWPRSCTTLAGSFIRSNHRRGLR